MRGLELILVETVGNMRIWNEMMIREHPRGAGPLVGRQLRYLVISQYGFLALWDLVRRPFNSGIAISGSGGMWSSRRAICIRWFP